MKAIICTKYGSADYLELQDVPKPIPKDNEVLIKMHATSVTASDVLMRALDANLMFKIIIQMVMGFGKPRNPILGMVGAGVVNAVGKDVTTFKPGDEVFAYGSKSMSQIRWGFYGEYMCLPEDWNIAHKPENLTFEEATAIPYGTLLAMHVMEKTDIQPRQKVLIYGASGSIGTMAIQLAKHAGAEVTAVCSRRNFDLVTSLGADKVIDYTRDDAVAQLARYDWVLDTVGGKKTSPLKDASKTALTANGQYLSVDKGTPTVSRDKFLRVKELAEQGILKPIIDRCYSLEKMVEAHTYVETGHKRGNVIVTIGT
jgi:NADPH:quinone reductase-like Zn-dependent oxidoreductase